MKRTALLFLVIAFSLTLFSCSKKETVALKYPFKSDSPYLQEAVPIQDIIFSTTGSENGLAGSIFSFAGTVSDSGNFSGTDYVIIETDNGKVLLTNMYEYLRNTLRDTVFSLLVEEPNSDYSLPAKGEKVEVIATYGGFSGTFNLPSLHLGANPYIVEDYRSTSDDNQPADNSPPQTVVPDLFSSDERQDEFKKLYTSYQYQALLDMLNNYINQESPESTDSVYKLMEYVEPAAEVIKSCNVTYDDFDEKYTAKYVGNDLINQNTCVAASVCETDVEVVYGFVAPEWLFFDDLTIKFSEEEKKHYFYDHYDIQQEVLNYGITEYVIGSLGLKEMELYLNAETVTMRFKNSENSKTFDHTLSQTELDAMKAMSILYKAYRNCSDIQFRWNAENA